MASTEVDHYRILKYLEIISEKYDIKVLKGKL